MSVLSPAALALLNSLQSTVKSDSGKQETPADDATFLNLLEGGKNNFSANTQTEQSLVDTLYQKDAEPEPVAVAQPTTIYIENTEPEVAPRRAEDVPVAVKQQAPEANTPKEAAPKPEAQAAAPKEKQAEYNNADKVEKPASSDEVSPKQEVAKAGEETDESLSLTEKLRGKINELSDLLHAVASLLGMGFQQITLVKVTQFTKTEISLTSTQSNLGVNQPMVDLSDRLDQLMAAISASQNLPSNIAEPLAGGFASFQSIAFSFTDTSGKFDGEAFLAQFSAAQNNLGQALQALSLESNPALAAGDVIDIGQFKDTLQKLSAWLSDTKTLISPDGAAPKAPVIEAMSEIMPKAQIQDTSLVLPLEKFNTGVKIKAEETLVTSNAPVAAAATASATPTAPVQTNVTNQSAAVATVAVANDQGASFSQQQSSGQGESKPQTAPIISASTGATNTSNTSAVTNFGKVLKAAAHTPAPMTEQVAFNIKTAVRNGDSKIQIHLDPVELGKLHIKMELASDGTAKGIVITADNKSTLDLLQRDARGLEQALADAGIKAESGSLSFNLRGGEQQKGETQQAFASYNNQQAEEDELAPLAVISRSYVVNPSDGLDIQI